MPPTHETDDTGETTNKQLTPSTRDDVVEIPVQPPRDPTCFRPTDHYLHRLHERVPERDRGDVPREIIKHGHVERQAWAPSKFDGEPGQPVAYTADVNAETYTVVTALRPSGFADPETKHVVLTVYTGEPSHREGDR